MSAHNPLQYVQSHGHTVAMSNLKDWFPFELKIQRSDTKQVGEYEVTVTSKLHAQAGRTKKQNREEEPASSGGAENPEQGIPE